MRRLFSVSLFIIFFSPEIAGAFSILTHEAVIDACWEKSMLPVLRKRFPNASDSDLLKAKGYAYGGCIMPDMGYFPFGSKLFTDIVHYCCNGDFTEALLSEAQNLNEYAFSLGALAHYVADNYGHPLGVNVVVPATYLKDKKKFGPVVTYEEKPVDHKRVEFAFDVLQVARGNYLPDNYEKFIGFEISKPVLERAFFKTYGLKLEDVFTNYDLNVSSCRWSVKEFFPTLTKSAWKNKKEEIQQLHPEITDADFNYKMSRIKYKKSYDKTPVRITALSFLIRISPKLFGDVRAASTAGCGRD